MKKLKKRPEERPLTREALIETGKARFSKGLNHTVLGYGYRLRVAPDVEERARAVLWSAEYIDVDPDMAPGAWKVTGS